MATGERTRDEVTARLGEVLGEDYAAAVMAMLERGEEAATRDDLGSLEERLERRFEQIDQRFEQIDQRFEQMERRFDEQLRWRLDSLGNHVLAEVRLEMNAQTHNLHNQIAAAQHALANQIRLLFLGTLAAMTAAATVVVT
ncbi:MAG: hypothetical protein ACRDUY_02830, partial [Nitriliruptorales bacterium]